MFELFDDMARGLGKVVGTGLGAIAGVSSVIIANTLGITIAMVEEAREAGCETYDEIREFFDL